MYDVIFLATIVAFFMLCVAYVRGCDRIIGPDVELELDGDRSGAAEAAMSEERAA